MALAPIPIRYYDPIAIARQFLFVREAQSVGQNRGLWVEAIQHAAGGSQGDSWCMEFVWDVECIAYQGNPPIARMQSCEALRQLAVRSGCVVRDPQPCDLYLYINAGGVAHHVGIVTATLTSTSQLTGIAGNTSVDGRSANGDRVAEHPLPSDVEMVFVRLPFAPPSPLPPLS